MRCEGFIHAYGNCVCVCLNFYTACIENYKYEKGAGLEGTCVCVSGASHTEYNVCVFLLYTISIWLYMIMYRGLMKLILAW